MLIPLINAHAHNDYAQPNPLKGALERGFCSIEADVFLVNGILLVGHDRKDLNPDRTLTEMYLKPLADRVKTSGGTVYGKKQELILLVDIKADGAAAYEQLQKDLKPFQSFLTGFSRGRTVKRAVKVILSGDRPITQVAAQKQRWVFIDGRKEDLGGDPNLFPLVSESFLSIFKYMGRGDFGQSNSEAMTGFVTKAHQAKQIVRFWATPETPTMWSILTDHKVDLIGTDKQADLAAFLTKKLQR
ncbi:MAG: phosphatidylinositol-specific phospholipase C/glycerophosphodiester phosphodiesterase family protein [Armatimonadota bacterium]